MATPSNGKFAPTDEERAEIDRYIAAYRTVATVEKLANYRQGNRAWKRQLKNDAEYAATAAAPQAAAWYATVCTAMRECRDRQANKPLWDKILQSRDARLGHMVMYRTSALFPRERKGNGTAAQNGNHVEAQQPLPDVLPSVATITARAGISRREAEQRYMAMVQTYSLLPPDSLIATLWGCTRQWVNHIRGDLEIRGFEFAAAELPEWANGGGNWWRIVKRPLTEGEIMKQLETALSDKIRAKSLSKADMMALIELLGN